MPLVVEYLALILKSETFCDSIRAFNKLLQSDSSLTIKKGTIAYGKQFSCGYQAENLMRMLIAHFMLITVGKE